MARKSGCPFTVRDYSIKIENKVTDEEVLVKGLGEMSVDVESETDDGKTGDSIWSEMFIKGRSVAGSLSGRPIYDRATGVRDPGQNLMHRAAMNAGGCDNDQTIIVADAIGRAVKYDCVITGESVSADEDGETISWDWEGVGEPREMDYVQAARIDFDRSGISVNVGETAECRVKFTPENASNQRYSYSIADEGVATLHAIDGLDMSIRGVSEGRTTLTVKSMNNNLIAETDISVAPAH